MRVPWPILTTLAALAGGCSTIIDCYGGADGTGGVSHGVANPRTAAPHVDRIVQVVHPEVDVLWVVDDSPSMPLAQDALVERLPLFFDGFDGLGIDFHVGVVSTDMVDPMRSGQLVTSSGERFVDLDTPDPLAVLGQAMRLGVGAHPNQALDAVHSALHTRRYGSNHGFLRGGSAVRVIVVATEVDVSEGDGASGVGPWLRSLGDGPSAVSFSAIAPPSDAYDEISTFLGGARWTDPEPDWDGAMKSLGREAGGLAREFFLSTPADPDTLEVSVVDDETTFWFTEGEDWSYDPVRNSVRFHEYVPRLLAEVVIEYVPLGV